MLNNNVLLQDFGQHLRTKYGQSIEKKKTSITR